MTQFSHCSKETATVVVNLQQLKFCFWFCPVYGKSVPLGAKIAGQQKKRENRTSNFYLTEQVCMFSIGIARRLSSEQRMRKNMKCSATVNFP